MDLKLLPHNPMTFTENQHGNAVLEKLRQQRELVRCCDVILHVDGKQFHAHRCVLSACSPFFDSLFKASKTVKEQLTIRADSSEVFPILLAYMYTGTVIVDKKNVSELLKLANKLLLNKLKEYCAEYLQRYLDTRNCLTVLEMATKYCLESLQKIANNHIDVHLIEIIEGDEILELSLLRLENFIKSSHWHLSNEEILVLVTAWVYHKAETREGHLRALLSWVSWPDVDPNTVSKLIQKHNLFSFSHKCRSAVFDVLEENNLLCESPYDQLADLRTRMDESNDDDSDKFLNLAITTAIDETLLNEPNVDKFLMDTGKELVRGNFPPNDPTQFEWRDLSQTKTSNLDFHPSSQHAITLNAHNTLVKNSAPENVPFQQSSNYSQSFDIEELCKYTIENTQKLKQELMGGNSEDELNNSSLKQTEYQNATYEDHPANCYHYRDNFSVQNGDKCLKMTNKGSYMNHKYDAIYSTQLSSFSDFNYQKNGVPSSDTNSAQGCHVDLSKEPSLNFGPMYSNEHIHNPASSVPVPFAQDLTNHFFPNFYKKEQSLLPSDTTTTCDPPNTTLPPTFNLNTFPDMKYEIGSAQPEMFYMECSDDTQSSNNCPKDMSLTHLKLSEYESALDPQSNKDKSRVNPENELPRPNSECKLEASPDAGNNKNNYNETIYVNLPTRSPRLDLDANIDEAYQSVAVTQAKELKEKRIDDLEANSINQNSQNEIPQQQEEVSRPNETNSGPRTVKRKKKSERDLSSGKAVQEKQKDLERKRESEKVEKSCDICNAAFDRKRTYFAHMLTHFPGPPHQCDTCNSNFKRIYYLLDHRLIHLEGKPFKCPQCPFTSRKKFNLTEHMSLHQETRPFKCDECGSFFNRKQHLEIHKTKHTDVRSVICDTCGWTGKTRNSLLFHLKIHTGDLYSCQYPDCAYRTPKKYHLREHMQYHTKSRPFACKFCSLRFISKSNLQKHLLKHLNPSRCQCPHCHYCTTRLDILKTHIKRKHSETKPPIRPRRGQLKKRDALLLNSQPNNNNSINNSINNVNSKKNEAVHNFTPNEATLFLNVNGTGGRLSPLPHYPTPSFDDDPDDPLTIVSEMEEDPPSSLSSFHQSAYLDPSSSIGQAFSGLLLDVPPNRFTLAHAEDIYYSEV